MSETQYQYSGNLPLRSGQITRLIGCGVLLWFVAALLLRFLVPMGVLDGFARFITYALIIPGTFPFLLTVGRLCGLARNQYALGVAVTTATALMCDGIAVAWLPDLYGATTEHVKLASAAILWGGGAGLVLGFLINRVQR